MSSACIYLVFINKSQSNVGSPHDARSDLTSRGLGGIK